jgi:hypothetical protein
MGQGRKRRRSDHQSGKAVGTSTGGRDPALPAERAHGRRIDSKRRKRPTRTPRARPAQRRGYEPQNCILESERVRMVTDLSQ